MILLLHPIFGVLSMLAAVWVAAEAVAGNPATAPRRIRLMSAGVAVAMAFSAVFGGYWYLASYPPERAIILAGPWPFAHSVIMETKEHVFFSLLALSFLLPIAAADDMTSPALRRLVATTAVLVVALTLVMEGMGALVAMGVKIALLGE